MGHDLDWLNLLSERDAEAELLKGCASLNWARRMVKQRPFGSINELLGTADNIWWSLEPNDWLEAFRSHPKIGEKNTEQETSAEAKAWSEQEQSGTRNAAQTTMEALAESNRQYEQKFGFIFIVCATGKSSEEMLAILRERFSNDRDKELRIAAEEQRRITRLRLEKLITNAAVNDAIH